MKKVRFTPEQMQAAMNAAVIVRETEFLPNLTMKENVIRWLTKEYGIETAHKICSGIEAFHGLYQSAKKNTPVMMIDQEMDNILMKLEPQQQKALLQNLMAVLGEYCGQPVPDLNDNNTEDLRDNISSLLHQYSLSNLMGSEDFIKLVGQEKAYRLKELNERQFEELYVAMGMYHCCQRGEFTELQDLSAEQIGAVSAATVKAQQSIFQYLSGKITKQHLIRILEFVAAAVIVLFVLSISWLMIDIGFEVINMSVALMAFGSFWDFFSGLLGMLYGSLFTILGMATATTGTAEVLEEFDLDKTLASVGKAAGSCLVRLWYQLLHKLGFRPNNGPDDGGNPDGEEQKSFNKLPLCQKSHSSVGYFLPARE